MNYGLNPLDVTLRVTHIGTSMAQDYTRRVSQAKVPLCQMGIVFQSHPRREERGDKWSKRNEITIGLTHHQIMKQGKRLCNSEIILFLVICGEWFTVIRGSVSHHRRGGGGTSTALPSSPTTPFKTTSILPQWMLSGELFTISRSNWEYNIRFLAYLTILVLWATIKDTIKAWYLIKAMIWSNILLYLVRLNLARSLLPPPPTFSHRIWTNWKIDPGEN